MLVLVIQQIDTSIIFLCNLRIHFIPDVTKIIF